MSSLQRDLSRRFFSGRKLTIALAFQIGDVIAGKYRIDAILGAGGMGVVVAAHHLSLDDVVAIKFLSAELANQADAVSRFDREARAAAKIKSEHVARVFDVDRLPDGVPYMVMEHLEGVDLAALIQQGEPLSEARAVGFVLQACSGLAEAHRVGIVHRDIKPSNLFCVERVNREPTIKLLDFGISKLTLSSDSAHAVITGTGAAMGSPAYMSPEQMRSAANVDARTDIWSLGVVLYELLTGKLPFTGSSYPELCLKIAGDAPASPRLYRPDLSPTLEAIILKCLEKDCQLRFATVGELAQALSPLSPTATPVAPSAGLSAAPVRVTTWSSAPAAQLATLPLALPEPAPSGKSVVTNATWTQAKSRSEAPKNLMAWGVGSALGVGLLLTSAGVWWAHARNQPGVASASPSQHVQAATPEPSALPASSTTPPVIAATPAAGASQPASAPSASAGKLRSPVAPKPSPAAVSPPPTQRSKNAIWNQRN
jgi:serine/threonine-protein kinase